MVNLDHAAIEDWGWPSMTMDFNVADDIDISQLTEGMSLHLQITKLDSGDYYISTIHIVDEDGNMMHMEEMMDMDDIKSMDHSSESGASKEVDHTNHGGQY